MTARDRRSFAGRVAQTAGANVLITMLAGGAGLYLAAVLGADDRGRFAAIQSWFGVLTIVGESGITAATCFFVAREPRRAAQWMSTSATLLLAMGLATMSVGLSLSQWLAARTTAPIVGFALVFLVMPLMFIAGAWTFTLQAVENRAWNLARAANAVVYASGIALIGLFGRLSVVSAVACLAAAVAFQAAVARAMARARIAGARPQLAMVRPLLGYGLRSLAGTAPFAFNARIDQVLLTLLVPSAELGNYAVAVALTLLAQPMATAFGGVIMPSLAAGDDVDDARGLIARSLFGSLLAGAGVVVPLAVVAPLTVTRLLGTSFADVPVLIALLAPGAVVLGCNQVLGDILRGMGRPLDVARCEAVGLAATATLLLTLVGPFGARGAAAASSLAYSVSFLLLLRRVRRVRAETRSPGQVS